MKVSMIELSSSSTHEYWDGANSLITGCQSIVIEHPICVESHLSQFHFSSYIQLNK